MSCNLIYLIDGWMQIRVDPIRVIFRELFGVFDKNDSKKPSIFGINCSNIPNLFSIQLFSLNSIRNLILTTNEEKVIERDHFSYEEQQEVLSNLREREIISSNGKINNINKNQSPGFCKSMILKAV